MIHLSLSYDDLRKIGTALRKPDASLTACGPASDGGLRVTVLADVAKLADLTHLVKSLKVSITLDLALKPLGDGRIQLTVLDLTLDKSQVPLLVRPFLRPNTFRSVLFSQLAKRDDLTTNSQAGTIVVDLNDLQKLKERGMTVDVRELDVTDDGVAIGLTLADRNVD